MNEALAAAAATAAAAECDMSRATLDGFERHEA